MVMKTLFMILVLTPQYIYIVSLFLSLLHYAVSGLGLILFLITLTSGQFYVYNNCVICNNNVITNVKADFPSHTVWQYDGHGAQCLRTLRHASQWQFSPWETCGRFQTARRKWEVYHPLLQPGRLPAITLYYSDWSSASNWCIGTSCSLGCDWDF